MIGFPHGAGTELAGCGYFINSFDARTTSNLERRIPRQFGANPPGSGKSPLDRECVVGLRGLELRAKHAVAIEPVSRE